MENSRAVTAHGGTFDTNFVWDSDYDLDDARDTDIVDIMLAAVHWWGETCGLGGDLNH